MSLLGQAHVALHPDKLAAPSPSLPPLLGHPPLVLDTTGIHPTALRQGGVPVLLTLSVGLKGSVS